MHGEIQLECRQIGHGILNLTLFVLFLFVSIYYELYVILIGLPFVLYSAMRHLFISQKLVFRDNRLTINSVGDKFFFGKYSIEIEITAFDLKRKVNSVFIGNPRRSRSAMGVGFIEIGFDGGQNICLGCDIGKILHELDEMVPISSNQSLKGSA